MGKLMRCITVDGAVMAMALDATDMVARAEQIHKTSAVVTAGLGRLLIGASMMGVMMKGERDSVTLKVEGGGPAGTLTAVSDSKGNVRGYASQPVVEIPLKPNGKLDVSGAVGADGLLYVMRDSGGAEPYVGSVPLVSGEIAEDITSYYAVSEQTPTVCSLGVLVNPDLTVKTAGGLLIQLLPFCPEEVIDTLERNVAALPSMTEMLSRGLTVEDILQKALRDMPFDLLDTYEPAYRCACSREKVMGAFAAMTPEDLRALPDEEGKVEVTCRFCDAVYRFDRKEIEAMAAAKERGERI